MDNLILWEALESVPENAQKTIKGGRLNGFTDINPMWRMKKLTEEFGPVGIGWYYKVTNKWIEHSGNEAAAFVDIELYYKHEGEWSMPIPGTGGSSFVANQASGLYMSDECYKMALTDAISVACKALGVGSNIYWNTSDSKYGGIKNDGPDISNMSVEDIGKLKISFGKHSGKTLSDIWHEDVSYIKWLSENERTDQWIKDAIDKTNKFIKESKEKK